MSTDTLVKPTTSLDVEPATAPSLSASKGSRWADFPIGLGMVILAQIPYVLLYFKTLQGYSHYDFFPFAIGCFAVFFWLRYGGRLECGKWRKFFMGSLIAGSLLFCACALLFSSPWIAYLGFLLGTLALLLSIRDSNTNRSLWNLIILLAILWQPPYSPNQTGDVVFTGILQRLSTRFVSITLDNINMPHFNSGTIISMKGKEFGVEEACSGVQSLFFYIAIASMLAVYHRRSILHSIVLIGSAVFWSFFTNSLRILSITTVWTWFAFDLSTGWVHDLIGYVMMLFGAFLIWSFDRALCTFTSYEVDEGDGEGLKKPSEPMELSVPGPRRPFFGSKLAWGVVAIFVLLFSAQLVDAATAFTANRKKIDFFTGNPIKELAKEDFPPQLAGWTLRDYKQEKRVRGADFGERSDIWVFQKDSRELTFSFDQAFPGWHELTKCYQNAGWKMRERVVRNFEGPDVAKEDAFVLASFVHTTGRLGTIAFGLIDERSTVLEPPGKWDLFSSLYHRATNRLSPQIRAQIFGGAAFQFQCMLLADSVDAAAMDEEEMTALMSEALPFVRQIVLTKRAGQE